MAWTPPRRAPGDPPWKYGNDIPDSYLKAFDAKVRAEIEAADARLAAKRAEADHAKDLDHELERSLQANRKRRAPEDGEDHDRG